MADKLIISNGGPADMLSSGGILETGMMVRDTMAGKTRPADMRYGDVLVKKTQGETLPTIMAGVLTNTRQGIYDPKTPLTPAVPKMEVGKTQSKRMGQTAYAGPMY